LIPLLQERERSRVVAASILTISVDEIRKRVVWRTVTLLLMITRGSSHIEAVRHLRGSGAIIAAIAKIKKSCCREPNSIKRMGIARRSGGDIIWGRGYGNDQ
jgi:hypothetical protein